MRIRFWGTRGSLAKPGPTTLRYGGNTSCVEVRLDDGTLLVLDAGTGAHDLGRELLREATGPLRGHMLITHTHWDHIQGFPFFGPLFVPGNEWDLYAPGGLGQSLEGTLNGQMEYTYFPVTLKQLGATIRFHDLVEGSFTIGGLRVSTSYLNHPAVTLGYRLEVGGASFVYSTDYEPRWLNREAAGGQQWHPEDWRHGGWIGGADLVVHDAQYFLDEYTRSHIGWGHSPAEWVAELAAVRGVKRLALFHHDPLHDDDAVDRLVELCRERVAAAGGTTDVFGAREGETIELPENARDAPPTDASAAVTGANAIIAAGTGRTVLVGAEEPELLRLLTEAARPENLRLVFATDADAVLRLAHTERPALILLDWRLIGHKGLDACRALRRDPDPGLRDVPVVLITPPMGPDEIASGVFHGVTDHLTLPFAAAHLRSRVNEWLLRSIAAAT